MGNNIDILFNSNMNIKKIINNNSFFIDLYFSNSKIFLFFPTVHAHNIKILKILCKKISKNPQNYDGISVGGLFF